MTPLCEPGIRIFETMTRNSMDLNAIPAVHRLSHLPVVVDPGHGSGHLYLVTPLARAAAAVGADGLMIELQSYPHVAKRDGSQSLNFENFSALMAQVNDFRHSAAISSKG